jgi:hypothetical protein
MTDPYRVLSLKQDWNHSHPSGWAPAEIYRFADSICFDKDKMLVCETEPTGRRISFAINKADGEKVCAKAYYLTQKLSYSRKEGQDRPTPDQAVWKSVACAVNGTQITGSLPAEAVNYYVEMTASGMDGTYTTSTGLVDVYD